MSKSESVRRRRLRFSNLRAVAVEAEQLLHAGYERAGRWSLGQVCTHLAQAMEASSNGPDGFDGFMMPMWYRPVAKPILHWILVTGWIPAGVKLPDAALPTEAADEVSVERLRRAVERVDRHVGPWSPHPFFGSMTATQWQRYHRVHAAHHLGFLVPR